ncbi:LysR substrate-binding domain-containing protein [Sneathiella limimaris]|uniref:LysR substrate-binding domain-containing protein n=1 Tax=Sneathiella limimaris TaxID=1964213 RepID=UPI00146B5978|nr:LysR substrate-binding domain-containing protein [Sneathiella limimaris]
MYYSQFRAFHAVATQGGFSKAADHLGLTQPAVSDQVKKLEERFNVLLFNRHKRTVQLTPLGHQLLEITQKSFQLETQAIDLLNAHQSLEKGHINVAADTPLHIIPLIGKFKKSFGGISVSLRMGVADQIIAGLLDFSYDIGIVADMPNDPRFHAITLCEDPLVAFVAKSHPLAKTDTITLKELSDYPLIIREPGSRTRDHTEEEFRNADLHMNIVMEVQGREAAREAVAAEIGVGIVSEPEFGHDNRLKALKLTDCKATMTESLVCLKEKKPLKPITAFFNVHSS